MILYTARVYRLGTTPSVNTIPLKTQPAQEGTLSRFNRFLGGLLSEISVNQDSKSVTQNILGKVLSSFNVSEEVINAMQTAISESLSTLGSNATQYEIEKIIEDALISMDIDDALISMGIDDLIQDATSGTDTVFFSLLASYIQPIRLANPEYKSYANELQVIEKFSNFKSAEQKDVPVYDLINFDCTNGIFKDLEGTAIVFPSQKNPSFPFKSPLKTQIGDIFEVTATDRKSGKKEVIFVGEVESTQFTQSGQQKEVQIKLSSFLSTLNTRSYQATLLRDGQPVNQQISTNRSTPKLLQGLTTQNYLKYAPMFTDLSKTTFFGMFQVNDSQRDVLNKLCEIYLRLCFQRKDNTVLISQLFTNDIQKFVNFWDWSQLSKFAYDIDRKIDFSDTPYTGILNWTNSPILTAGVVSGSYQLKSAPLDDTIKNNIQGNPIEFPNDSNLSLTLAVLSSNPDIHSSAVDVNLEFNPKASSNSKLSSSQIKNNKNLMANFAKFQLLSSAYSKLPNTDVITFKLPYFSQFMEMDAGDMIKIPRDKASNNNSQTISEEGVLTVGDESFDLYAISQFEYDLEDAEISLSVIPLVNTTPSLPLTSPPNQNYQSLIPPWNN